MTYASEQSAKLTEQTRALQERLALLSSLAPPPTGAFTLAWVDVVNEVVDAFELIMRDCLNTTIQQAMRDAEALKRK